MQSQATLLTLILLIGQPTLALRLGRGPLGAAGRNGALAGALSVLQACLIQALSQIPLLQLKSLLRLEGLDRAREGPLLLTQGLLLLTIVTLQAQPVFLCRRICLEA